MNEVSIIINGVRYDAVDVPKEHELRPCAYCDMIDYCLEAIVDVTCASLGIINKHFKKSDKSLKDESKTIKKVTRNRKKSDNYSVGDNNDSLG